MGKTIYREELRNSAKEALKNEWKKSNSRTARWIKRNGKSLKRVLFSLGTVLCGVAGATLVKAGPMVSMAFLLADGICLVGYGVVENARNRLIDSKKYVKTLNNLLDELKRSPDEIVEISFATFGALKSCLPKTRESRGFLRKLGDVKRVEKTQVQIELEDAIESIAMVVKEAITQEDFQAVREAVERAAEEALGRASDKPENGLRTTLGTITETKQVMPNSFSCDAALGSQRRSMAERGPWGGKW